MTELWNSLIFEQQIFACIAIPATLLLIIMIILMLIGFGDNDVDADADVDVDADVDIDGDVPDAGLSLFTSRGIIAMLTIMGWSGVVFLDPSLGLHKVVGILIAVALGALAMFLMALAMRGISKLQSSGNIDINNAVGKVAQVYLTIPAGGKSPGKVNLTIQEKLSEFSAITTEDCPLPTGSYVRVVSVSDGGVLVVEQLKSQEKTT